MKVLIKILIVLFSGMALMLFSKGELVASLAKDLVHDTAKFGITLAHAEFLTGLCIFVIALITLVIYAVTSASLCSDYFLEMS